MARSSTTFQKGHRQSEESREKMSESHKRRWKLGLEKGFQKGHSTPEEWKQKYREANRKLIGEKANNWKGGTGYSYKRKLIIRKNGGSHTLGELENLKAQYNWTCPSCKRKEPEIKLTQDHIIPVSKGGSDNIENIQPLCKSCNAKKHNKVIKYDH